MADNEMARSWKVAPGFLEQLAQPPGRVIAGFVGILTAPEKSCTRSDPPKDVRSNSINGPSVAVHAAPRAKVPWTIVTIISLACTLNGVTYLAARAR